MQLSKYFFRSWGKRGEAASEGPGAVTLGDPQGPPCPPGPPPLPHLVLTWSQNSKTRVSFLSLCRTSWSLRGRGP